MNLLILLSDLTWEWKLFTWPMLISMLVVLWISRKDQTAFFAKFAPYVRIGLMLLAAISLSLFLVAYFSISKGQDRLAYIPVGLSLFPLWLSGLIATLLVPRVK